MKLTITQAHRINLALNAVARGFPNGDAKNVPVLRTAAAKLAVARNLRNLRDAIEPVENTLQTERDRLADQERQENPDASQLSGPRLQEFNRLVREVNAEEIEIQLHPVPMKDVDLDHFQGEEAMQALAELDGTVLKENP